MVRVAVVGTLHTTTRRRLVIIQVVRMLLLHVLSKVRSTKYATRVKIGFKMYNIFIDLHKIICIVIVYIIFTIKQMVDRQQIEHVKMHTYNCTSGISSQKLMLSSRYANYCVVGMLTTG